MKNNSFGKKLIAMGAAFILAAALLFCYNVWQQNRAEKISSEALQTLLAGLSSANIENTMPDYMKNPDMEMPVTEIDGIDYVGYIEIPYLDLKLPVVDEINDDYLKKSPCRDSGTAYKNNLVLGAHNYSKHFGQIGDIPYGEDVLFYDLDGNKFSYQVANIEILQPTQVEELHSGEYPLSLFTCTWGGRERVVVRCE